MEIMIKEACDKGFWLCLEPSDWISLIAVFIAMIAAVASWGTIISQERINKKNKEAIIVPGIKHIDTSISHILSDWDDESDSIIGKKFSKTTLPIWNHGNSPVFNIQYCYYLENFGDIKANENKMGLFSNYEINLDTSVEDSKSITVSYNNINERQGVDTRYIKPFVRTLDVIKPNERANILLPDYFIILLNDFFFNSFLTDNRTPVLQLKIFYDDVYLNTWEKQFRIIPGPYNFKGEELNTSFEYEIILDKKKRIREPRKI
ncbi:hypothetical protein D5E69_23135 (plasmid) [Rossellomorea marisflavi]|uniref:hypothetical protein n=1 Tax=Rossellomorea marisflavi TaxID=189381 RepID=UPI0013194F47|nr:hypothetical protein [Rossellomorea marisflavi]QHA38729.1 hypothetical protein D5E69_23135 [Rossellomorea marisflavi]